MFLHRAPFFRFIYKCVYLLIEWKSCWDAASYCGVLNEKYPDKKPMGYPFDRPMDKNVTQLSQFLTPNMATANIRIQFEDDVIRHFR